MAKKNAKIKNNISSEFKNYEKEKYQNISFTNENPISSAYPVIDTDLARDNLENDLTSADKQDL